MPETPFLVQRLSATRLDQAAEWTDPQREPMTALPLMGRVSAGEPVEVVEETDWVEVPTCLAPTGAVRFAGHGESMTEDQIEDGDLVLDPTALERR
jgi:repressor LexA